MAEQNGESSRRATRAAAVREALTHLGHQAPPREIARYLAIVFPDVQYTEKTLATTIASQRQSLRTDSEAKVSHLSELAARLASMGIDPDGLLARFREEAKLALSVGGRLQLIECLALLAQFNQGDGDDEDEVRGGSVA